MLAVKAKYENGKVRWEQKPPLTGMHDLIVVFADASSSDLDAPAAGPRDIWHLAQESTLAKVWDNQKDAIYDEM